MNKETQETKTEKSAMEIIAILQLKGMYEIAQALKADYEEEEEEDL